MEDCIFCRIIAGEIPCDKVYEDEDILAFRDIVPQAPVHVLIVPKRHMSSVLEADGETAARIVSVAKKIAVSEGVSETGFRLVSNCGHDAMQSVPHLHVHLLGGRQMADKLI